MLVDERVRLGVPDELDVVPEGRRAAHGGGFGRERGGVDDGLRPQEDGHAHLDGVGARGQTGFKAVGVALAGTRIGAGQADLAEQNREHGDARRLRFAVHAALRRPALRDEAGLRGGHVAGKAHDALCGHVRDAGGALGRLRSLVGTEAEDVAAVARAGLGGRRERVLVVADRVAVDEGLVDEVLGDEHVGDRLAEGRVGAGTDRNPLGVASGHRVGVDRVDEDHARAVPACGAEELPGLSAARGARDGGIVAERDVELRVLHLREVGALACGLAAHAAVVEAAVEVRPGVLDAGCGVVGVPGKRAADHVEEAVGGRARVDKRLIARAVHDHDGLVGVTVDGVLEAGGDFVEGLLPGDAFEAALAAAADALHRELEALGRIDALAHGSAALTSADLRAAAVDGARGGVARGVRLDADDASVLGEDAELAAGAAVDCAATPGHDLDVRGRPGNGGAHGRGNKGAEAEGASGNC